MNAAGRLKKMSKTDTANAAITLERPVKYKDVLEFALFLFITDHQTRLNKVNAAQKSKISKKKLSKFYIIASLVTILRKLFPHIY
jgi:hypothetical protein